MAKVQFGIGSVQYALITNVGVDGKPTYAPFKTINCPVSFEASPVGETNEFYCGDGVGATFTTDQGYEITLEGSMLETDFLVDVMGEELDSTSGALFQNASANPKPFALKISTRFKEEDVDVKDIVKVFYFCTAQKAGFSASTSTDTVEGQTQSLTIKAKPLNTEKRSTVVTAISGDSAFEELKTTVIFPGEVTP